MLTTTPVRPREFALVVPGHWATFDMAYQPLADARRAALKQARTLRERLTAEDLFEQAKRVLRSARRAGALWGAGTATVYDDGLFVAQAMLFAVAAPEGEDFTAAVLGSVLGGERSGDDASLPTRSVSTVQLGETGTAVRVTGRERVRLTKNQQATMVVSHTFVPVPGDGRDYMLITCCSPNLAYEEQVLDLFDAIAGTFRFLDQDDLDALRKHS